MTLTIFACSLLMIVIGLMLLRLHPAALLVAGALSALAGLAQQASCVAGRPGPLCLGFGPDLASPLFAFAIVFAVPGVLRLVRRLRRSA